MAKETCEWTGSAADFLPRRVTLPALKKAAEGCRGCELYCHATQVVFGEGAVGARLMLIGEQPGDQEDLAGKPFVGPSGRLLNETLAAAGIERAGVYVTNAVKHFKWTAAGEGARGGKRRIHAKPTWTEVTACRPWLLEELKVVGPRVVVTLGATAAQSLMGKAFRVTQHRGEFLQAEGAGVVLATVHPSSLLRMPDAAAREEGRRLFLRDFELVAKKLDKLAG